MREAIDRKGSAGVFPRLALGVGLSACLLSLGACRHAPSPAERLLETPLGGELDLLWRAHGQLDAWDDLRGARFRIRVEVEDFQATLPEVLIDFRDSDRVWVRAGPAPAPWIEISLAAEIEPASPAGEKREALARALEFPGWRLDPARGGPLDYALRSLRSLFQLPHALRGPGWQLRRVLGDAATPGEFEANPWRDRFLVGPFLLQVPPASAMEPLQRVNYLSRHPFPFAGPALREVRFSQYVEFSRVLVALRREHRVAARSLSLETDDPLAPPSERAAPAVFLVEHIEELALLREAEVERVRENASVEPSTESSSTP